MQTNNGERTWSVLRFLEFIGSLVFDTFRFMGLFGYYVFL